LYSYCKKLQARVGFLVIAIFAHRSTLLKGTFELIYCRNRKIGEDRRIFRCGILGFEESETRPTWEREKPRYSLNNYKRPSRC
jgi:hypothetical protein